MAGNPMDLPEDQRWWYCLKHDRVEKGAGCPNKFRLGPYADEAAASGALRTVTERNEAWDAGDDPWEQEER